jgi:hypothetical protein
MIEAATTAVAARQRLSEPIAELRIVAGPVAAPAVQYGFLITAPPPFGPTQPAR